MGTKAGQGQPVELSATANALLKVLPSCTILFTSGRTKQIHSSVQIAVLHCD
jgi:urease accessory protein UreH